MNTKRMFFSALILLVFTSIFIDSTCSLLVPKGLSPNIIEDLESNYHNIKSLSEKAVQLKNLLSQEDFSSISASLDDLKNCVDNYEYQENRSGRLLQIIAIKSQFMEAGVDSNENSILNEGLLKEQAEDMQKLIEELEEKLDGIKADPMMFTKEKADDLYKRIQALKEKFSSVHDSFEGLYAVKEAKEAKMRQVDQLDHQKRKLEWQIKEVKYQKDSKDFSLESTDQEIGYLNQTLEEIQKQIVELEKPKPSPKAFHYIFLVDTSLRDENQKNFEEVYLNIQAIKAASVSEGDVFSMVTFDKEVQVLAERLPVMMNARLDLRTFHSQIHNSFFEKGLEKASQFLKSSRNKEEIPVVIVYMDGMKWYWEAKPIVEEEQKTKGEGFFRKIWNWIVNWFRSFFKYWFLKPIKESEIHEIKKQLTDFSERFSAHTFVGFVSGRNQEILRNFAKALNCKINENFESFNLKKSPEVLPQIFKTPSAAEHLREQTRKRIEKETEELRKKSLGQGDDMKDYEKNKLLKEKDVVEKKVNEIHRKRETVQSEIQNLVAEIGELQSEKNSTESKVLGLTEEIRLANEKILEQERMKAEREMLEAKHAEVRYHLDILEQLTKTVQARDHNILTIFEYVSSHYKDFVMSLKKILRNDEASDFDLLITFYKDRLGLDGTDVENMEKICQFWLGHGSDQAMAKNFFMMINPREMINGDLKAKGVEQAVEGLRERQNQYLKNTSLEIDDITRVMRNEKDFARKQELERKKILLEENLKKIEQEMEKLKRRDLEDVKEEYVEFYLRLRKKILAEKMEQKVRTMDSQRREIKSLFSKEVKELMEKLEKKKYMMYWL